MKTTFEFLIALVAALGMTTGCASNSPPPDEDPRQMDGAEPVQKQEQEQESNETAPPASEPSDELQPVQPEATSPDSVGDGEIDAFVDTFREVTEVRQAYQERMSQAPTSEDARALQQEAAAALQSVIERGELEPERFAEIAKLAETDPNVAQKIRERMADAGPSDS